MRDLSDMELHSESNSISESDSIPEKPPKEGHFKIFCCSVSHMPTFSKIIHECENDEHGRSCVVCNWCGARKPLNAIKSNKKKRLFVILKRALIILMIFFILLLGLYFYTSYKESIFILCDNDCVKNITVDISKEKSKDIPYFTLQKGNYCFEFKNKEGSSEIGINNESKFVIEDSLIKLWSDQFHLFSYGHITIIPKYDICRTEITISRYTEDEKEKIKEKIKATDNERKAYNEYKNYKEHKFKIIHEYKLYLDHIKEAPFINIENIELSPTGYHYYQDDDYGYWLKFYVALTNDRNAEQEVWYYKSFDS